jgi:hypothetical protein
MGKCDVNFGGEVTCTGRGREGREGDKAVVETRREEEYQAGLDIKGICSRNNGE